MKVKAAGDEISAWFDDQSVLTARPGQVDLESPAVTIDDAPAATAALGRDKVRVAARAMSSGSQ